MENYYYNRLNKLQQAAYHDMYTGLKNLAPSFQVKRLEGKELSDIYFALRMDHPEIFYTATFKYRYYQEADNIELIPEYIFEKKKIMEHQKALRSRVEKLARQAKDLKEWDKIKYVHDFICTSVHYDKLKKTYSHEIIGPLGQGVGVCEGIAKSVKILCDELGIWCVIAISGNNPEKGIKYRHTWNIIKYDGKYYNLDATFDNSLGTPENIRYDYFMLADKQIERDHEPVLYKMPECVDNDHFYYKEKKLSFTKMEDVQKRSIQAAKKGKILDMHWRGGHLTRDVLLELIKIIEEEAAKKDRHALVSVNWPQSVVRVDFRKDKPVDALVEQEANEGEQETGDGSEGQRE